MFCVHSRDADNYAYQQGMEEYKEDSKRQWIDDRAEQLMNKFSNCESEIINLIRHTLDIESVDDDTLNEFVTNLAYKQAEYEY